MATPVTIETTYLIQGTVDPPAPTGFSLTTAFTPPPECSSRWIQTYYQWPLVFSDIFEQPRPTGTPTNYYTACHPNNKSEATYYPGMCPSGSSIARIIETRQDVTTTSFSNDQRQWHAWCCKSGATWAASAAIQYGACQSHFSTPFTAFAPFTVTTVSGTDTRYPEYFDTVVPTTTVDAAGSTVTSTVTAKNTTVLTSGTAYLGAAVLFFRSDDLYLFPTDYASSVASVIGVEYTPTPGPARRHADPSPASSSVISGPTNPPTVDDAIVVGTNAKYGTGAVFGAAVLLGVGALLFVLWRRKKQVRQHVVVPEMAKWMQQEA